MFAGRDGNVVLDQLRAVDSRRLVRYLGDIDEDTAEQVVSTLAAMFAP